MTFAGSGPSVHPDPGAPGASHPGAPGAPQPRSEPFAVAVDRDGDVVRVAPTGELDLATSARLDQQLDELHDGRVRSLVLDLRGLTFIDASGVRAVLEECDRARREGCAFAVVRGSNLIQRVFEVAGCEGVPFVSG